MKISRVKVQNIKGVREIEIQANPLMNELSGKNGAGKSSILDSICWAFAGKKYITDAKPVRFGEENAEIIVETDDLIITRRFSGEKTTLRVDGKERGKYSQTDLDSFFGDFTFDPLAFVGLKPRDQINVLLDLVGEDFKTKLDDANRNILDLETEQTVANRAVKQLGTPTKVEPVEPVDVSAIIEQRKQADAHNREQAYRENELQRHNDYMQNLHGEITAMETKLKQLRDEFEQGKISGAQLPQPEATIDTLEFDRAIADADATNRRAREYEAYQQSLEKIKLAKSHASDVVKNLKDKRAERDALIASAKLPIDGVEFTDSGISINGVPFAQMSSGEKIRASALIGMAVSPELRVMMIRNGSLLDDDGFAVLRELAESNDYQFWVESVGSGHGDAIVIEEGVVKK